jgi:1,4-dihydroxy-2-naphthoyl-CoA hydrolase
MTYAVHGEPTGFVALMGLELDRLDGDEARGHLVVRDKHLQPTGIVHGGVYAAIAESIASVATWVGVGQDKTVSGLSNHASFLRPVFAGDTITAIGTPRHRGRTTWVWEVELTNGEGKLTSLVRVTVAVREP